MATVVRNRSLFLHPSSHIFLLRLLRRSSSSTITTTTTTTRTTDTALNFDDIQGEDAGQTAKAAAAEKKQKAETEECITDHRPPRNSNDNVLPFAPSLKLENRELDVPPWPPYFQQKRRLSDQCRPNINLTPCIGSDGRPIDREDWSSEKEEFVDDYKRYYAHHKASPLSEIEFVDTRKPITRATDAVEGDTGRGVMVEETVDQALARAEEIFRMRAMMGDPSLPHSKVLRRMLRQSCDSSVDV